MTQAEVHGRAATDPTVGVIGISYRTAPLAALERLALSGEEITELYRSLAADAAIRDAMVISTCNRTEIYTVADGEADPSPSILRVLHGLAGSERLPAQDQLYVRRGRPG